MRSNVRVIAGVLSVVSVVALQGCVGPLSSRRAVAPPSSARPTVQTGRASWYGQPHHGQLTASGERFDMHALTAAHPTLPFGTRLRVVNLDNDREVDVRVNDRGPTVPGRIIDLSYAAARALGAIGAGVIPVRLTVLGADHAAPARRSDR
jgi:rare lipoprotein A